MVNSRQKGATGENKLIQFLKDKTGYDFTRTPGSGSGKIKGDITAPGCLFCIEIKNYKEDSLNSNILCNKTSLIPKWWTKLKKESKTKKPLLFYRWNRSKWFVVTDQKPTKTKNYLDFPLHNCYILLAEEWIESENITWFLSQGPRTLKN